MQIFYSIISASAESINKIDSTSTGIKCDSSSSYKMFQLILYVVAIFFVDLYQATELECVGTTDITRFFKISDSIYSEIQRSVSINYLH